MKQLEKIFSNVLLIEDEDAHAMLIDRVLRPLVDTVHRCASVSEARSALRANDFDLVVSDLNLPDLRSEAVVLSIREVSPSIPLLVLTSSALLSDGVSAMRAGASDFMVKNFDASFADVLQLTLSRINSARLAELERAAATRDRDLLREAVENSSDGLAVVSRDGGVRYCNSGFRAFLERFGVQGLNVLEIEAGAVLRGDGVLLKLKEHLAALRMGGVWTAELLGAKAEDDLAFEISLSASRDGANQETLVLWARDIQERKRRERFQREVISTTTHDLKGPLGAIAVSCDVLLDKPSGDDRAHALLERIATSANSAINLIEEFLSMRRIEEGAFVMHPVTAPLVEPLRRVMDSFAITAKTREVTLIAECEGEDLLGCVDLLGFERVVTNLISNAIKFSAKGGVVKVSLVRNLDGVVLRVSDCGVGMEPNDAKRIFNRYERLSAHAGVSGSGLGLFIVKSIVNAHGGAIDLSSVLGKGTTFEVFFPDRPPCNERGEVLFLDLA